MQEAQRAALARDLGVDLLCALVNNNSRCYDESLDFADHMGQILPVGQGVRAAASVPTSCAHALASQSRLGRRAPGVDDIAMDRATHVNIMPGLRCVAA